jgi:hypothetical protein
MVGMEGHTNGQIIFKLMLNFGVQPVVPHKSLGGLRSVVVIQLIGR